MDRLGWAAQTAVDVRGQRFAVRSTTAEIDAEVRRVLAQHVIHDDAVTPYFSIRFEDVEAYGPEGRRFRFLFRGANRAARTRTTSEILWHLLQQIDDVTLPSADGQIDVTAVVLVTEDDVILADPDLPLNPRQARQVERRARVGMGQRATLLPSTGEVLVREPDFSVDLAALEHIERREGVAAPQRQILPPGRHRVSRWVFEAPQTEALSPAAALVSALLRLHPAAPAEEVALPRLAAFVSQVPAMAVQFDDPGTIIERLTAR